MNKNCFDCVHYRAVVNLGYRWCDKNQKFIEDMNASVCGLYSPRPAGKITTSAVMDVYEK